MSRHKSDALIVVDMLNDFVLPGAPLEVSAARDILPALSARIARAREAGIPVIYVCDAHDPDDPEFAAWPPHAVEGTAVAEVIPELAPAPGDIVVKKKTLLGFYGTDLEVVLGRFGAETLTITGCVTNICIMYIATEASVRGYRVRIPRDSVAALDPAMHEFGLRQMAEVIKAEVF